MNTQLQESSLLRRAVVAVLNNAEAGAKTADLRSKNGVSSATLRMEIEIRRRIISGVLGKPVMF